MSDADAVAVFTYRCRQCGNVFKSNTECGAHCAHEHLVAAMHGFSYPPNQIPVSMVTWHDCGNNRSGLAELAGYVIEGEYDAESEEG